MKIFDSINSNITDITWLCISASTLMVGSIAIQFDAAEDGVVLSVEKMGDGGGFETSEKHYSDVTLKKIIDIFQNPEISAIIKEGENDTTYRFEDDSSLEGWEYNISCGNGDEILFSLSGCDYYCESLQTIISDLMSEYCEVKELDDFINGDYFAEEEETEE